MRCNENCIFFCFCKSKKVIFQGENGVKIVTNKKKMKKFTKVKLKSECVENTDIQLMEIDFEKVFMLPICNFY